MTINVNIINWTYNFYVVEVSFSGHVLVSLYLILYYNYNNYSEINRDEGWDIERKLYSKLHIV